MARKRRKLTKNQRERRNKGLLGLLVVFVIFIGGYLVGRKDITMDAVIDKLNEASSRLEERIDGVDMPAPNLSGGQKGTSQVHLLDVGQGSSILFIARDGTSVLVDTGRYDDGQKRIISYLDQYVGLGEKIDLLIFSHNDADHIGHGDLVLEYFDVQEVWMNGMDHTSQVYARLLDAILASDADYLEPKAGDVLQRGAFEIKVFHPTIDSPQKDFNAESLVTRLAFDGYSVMTSGDASIREETNIMKHTSNLASDILIVGHHGAADSTGTQWIQAVNPEIAFYQAGLNNSYGHPTPEALERLAQENVPVYGTDELGTISIYMNENGEVSVETEK